MNEAIDEFEFFLTKDWSDGLPVVTPTEERIARMLRGTRRDPEERIGEVPPNNAEATVRTVAIHALMAGCRPEYLPVVLGGLETILVPEFNMRGVQGTMHGVAPLLIVNGPYAKKIGLHGGLGCFGPGFRANATIGRALRLMLFNLGGGLPEVSSMSTFGQPSRYTYCIRENEEQSPWEPHSVTRGFGPEENVITAVMCENPHIVFDDVNEGENLIFPIADAMSILGCMNMSYRTGDIVVALSPGHAEVFARAGMSKADVHRRLCETAGRPLRDVKRGGHWTEERIGRYGFPIDPDDDDFFIPAVPDPARLHLIVAGGKPGPISTVMPGWNDTSRSVSRAFEV